MAQAKAGSTNPELLKRVTALWDNPAWFEFFKLYEPLVRDWCSGSDLDPDSVDELCQRVWVELARRMPVFQYDPRRSFRGWLRRMCQHRAIDMHRERRERSFELLEDTDLIDERWMAVDTDDAGDGAADGVLPQEAIAVQEEVRRKVKPARWEAFWRVVIEGESIRETATALGLRYATVYAGVNHVADLLRAEGQRRKPSLDLDSPPDCKGG